MELIYVGIVLIFAVAIVVFMRHKPAERIVTNNKEHQIINPIKGLKSDDLVGSKTNNEGILSGQINRNIKPMSKPAGWVPIVDESETETIQLDSCDVMIVDDSITVLEFLKIILRECDLSFAECKNGKESLNYLLDSNNKLPKLIVTDLDMPIMNGIDLINNIKKIKRLSELPILVVSANPTEAFPLLEQGQIKGIIKKPFDKRDLIGQINYIIEL